MINRAILEGNWNQLKGRLRQKWGRLTDSDIESFGGNVDELIGIIQQKTGEGRETVENYLQQLSDSASVIFGEQSEAMRDHVRHVAEKAYEGLSEVERWVRKCPSRTLAAGFGLGILATLLICVKRHRYCK